MNNMEFDHLFRLLFLGDSGVGKSCLILRYTENEYNSRLMNSIGVDYKMKNLESDGKKIKFQIWDTAGQERFRNITSSYYRGANVICIVYDITNRESFYNTSKSKLIKVLERFAKENVLKFLVGNKLDLKDKRKVTEDEGRELAKGYNMKFIEASAKDTINIDELFQIALQTYLEQLNSKPVRKLNTSFSDSSRGLTLDQVTIERNDFCCIKFS